ncbi:hypothetical protein SDRG_10741 [Saprolegnia diclina VS20]|uniref:Uncharacterized protein n=1 Tax=Saprolegnia diclina (strain VS20) TaxID=1156394 RepID=T0Q163_SAPDV|nr:hypothetical protein SDRG_10741 [Saprolegnia diclina VS20]EQC31569.1 hypothetical protein SDRG_10741 [Saprolegnia diclina VS20]|eukprot:XP_008614968.1 hypothetical protein SDRG_10741 [Saprolegnia diclina VS20]
MVLLRVVDVIADIFAQIGPQHNTPSNELVPDKFRSKWYLSPWQHAFEFVCYMSILIPLSIYSYQCAIQHPMWRAQRPVRKATPLDLALGVGTGVSYIAIVYYKALAPGMWRLPYALQPCHTLTLLLTLLTVARGKTANLLFQVYVTMSWSSVLALSFPDMSDYEHWGDCFNYFYEHIMMLLVPFVLWHTGRFDYIGSPSWIMFGFTFIALYHAAILQIVVLVTEINVATLMTPPAILKDIGIYYRPAQYLICFTLHWLYNGVITLGVSSFAAASTAKDVPSPKQL